MTHEQMGIYSGNIPVTFRTISPNLTEISERMLCFAERSDSMLYSRSMVIWPRDSLKHSTTWQHATKGFVLGIDL